MDEEADPAPFRKAAERLRQAMKANRNDVRKEREKYQQDHNLKDKVDTNNYSWAYDQTIIIRPVFDIYLKNMPLKRVGFC